MLRQTVRSFGALSLTDNSLPAAQLSRSFSSPAKSADKRNNEDEVGTVRTWLADLKSKPIPESVPEFKASKSSGPGGQHANKTNSKVSLRFPVDKLKSYSPQLLHEEFQRHRRYLKNSHSFIVRAQESRSQLENKRICWDEMYEILHDIAEGFLRNEKRIAAKDKPLNTQRNDATYAEFNAKFTMTKFQYQALKNRDQKEKRKAKNAAAVAAAKEAKLKKKQEDKRKSGK